MSKVILPSKEAESLFSREQLAHRWSCSIETIKRHERAGRLPALKLSSRCTRYRLSDIEHVERATVGTKQEVQE
jgi:predicted site-specific integrase-resolvase